MQKYRGLGIILNEKTIYQYRPLFLLGMDKRCKNQNPLEVHKDKITWKR
jgi:hypothetical protein